MKKNPWIRMFLMGLMATGLILLLMGAAPVEKPQSGGTLTLLYSHATYSLDPHADVGTSGLYILNQVLESLVGVSDEGKIVPMLAASMPRISDGGKEYVFELRKGVTFHDGTDFTAEDVKFTFDRLLDPKVSTQASRVKEFVEGVTVLDSYRIRIRMNKPWVDFLTVMAYDKLFDIINPESVQKLGKEFGIKGIVGTGPFRFVEWGKGAGATVEKNKNYWQKGLPYLDKIVFKEIPEDATRELAFISGQGDVLLDAPYKSLAELKKKENMRIYKAGGGLVVAVWFNTTVPPFDNKKLRQAISRAIDQKAIVDSVYYGYGEAATSIFPAWSPAYTGGKSVYNIDEARALLKDAGYSPSNPLTFTMHVRNERDYMDIATILQAMWAPLGIKATLEPIAAAGMAQMMFGLNPVYKVAVQRIGFGPLVTDYSYRLHSGKSYSNQTGYNKKGGASNPRIDELLSQAASELNADTARKLNEEISRVIFAEDVPMPVICFPDNVDVAYDYVRNWQITCLDYLPRTTTWLSKKK
jgi:peptide/nickel transport system substrate-binding protein